MRIQPHRIAPLAAILVFALGGCASLDRRQADAMAATTVAVPGAWSASAPPLRAAAPAALAAWWRQFGDAQLERLIDTALTAAPDVRSAQAKLRQARASRDLAVANLYPSIGVSAGVTRSRTASRCFSPSARSSSMRLATARRSVPG